MDALSKFISMLARPKSAKAELEAALQRLDVSAAEEAVDALEARRRTMLATASDAEIAAVDTEIVAANRTCERVGALRAETEKRLAAIRDEEIEAERRQRFDDARKASAAAMTKLKRDYPDLARRLVDLIDTVAAAEIAINAVNAALPIGEKPLLSPERAVRALAEEPRKLVDETVTAKWFYVDAWGKVEEHYVSDIKSTDGITGTLDTGGGKQYQVQLKKVARRTFLDAKQGATPTPLSAAIRLPGLFVGQADFWRPAGPDGVAYEMGSRQPQVLDAVAAARRALDSKPADTRGEPFQRVEENVIDDAEAEELFGLAYAAASEVAR
ncbi:MAG: hypothetical protein E5Y73_11430 [Mesorhizobium sp.]|uniref:hypothetical protein n=1 Tax=Mesorhizobium sp. TaxID=1871066 RepID=UPI00122B9DFE|nr:hypothetical protein [Mesorhizobium sp.]TIL94523.1 MAG: hypothetical protein E5Y73_11430 [Mesorhizobium sp.]